MKKHKTPPKKVSAISLPEEPASPKAEPTVLEMFKGGQVEFLESVFRAEHLTYVLAGSIRSGKTIVILTALLLLSRIFKGSKWVVIRQDRGTLARTTLETFQHYVLPKNFIEGYHYTYNKSGLWYSFPQWGNSQIFFLSENYQEDKDFDKFKGLEVNGAFLSQVEELQKNLYFTVVQRVGQWKINPMPPAYIFADLNPTDAWPKEYWYDKFKHNKLPKNTFFQEMDIRNNPHIDPQYLKNLEETMPAEMYRRFVLNDWSAVDHINRLVSSMSIFQCRDMIPTTDDDNWYLGADIGHRGNDPSVFTLMKGGNIREQEAYHTSNLTEAEQKILHYMSKYNIPDNRVVIDGVGVGAGVVDNMENNGMYPIRMIGGAREILERYPYKGLNFAHWKAISYWIAGEMLKNHQIGGFENELLISDAQAIYVYFRKEREIWTEGKEELRARIGRSCDYWDSFVYACWARYVDMVDSGPSIYTSSMAAAEKKAEEPVEA